MELSNVVKPIDADMELEVEDDAKNKQIEISVSPIPSPSHYLKGVRKSTLTDEMRRALCEHKSEFPSSSQKEVQQWVEQKYNVCVSQATISNTLKRSAEYLESDKMKNSNVKRHRYPKYPDVEKELYEWFVQNRETMHITGEVIQGKAKEILHRMHGEVSPEFHFSNGWLDRFRLRHGIRDETRMIYRLEGRKKKERVTLAVCNSDSLNKVSDVDNINFDQSGVVDGNWPSNLCYTASDHSPITTVPTLNTPIAAPFISAAPTNANGVRPAQVGVASQMAMVNSIISALHAAGSGSLSITAENTDNTAEVLKILNEMLEKGEIQQPLFYKSLKIFGAKDESRYRLIFLKLKPDLRVGFLESF